MSNQHIMHNHIYLLALALVVISFILSAHDVFALEYSNYTSDKYQIQFQYPSDWTLHEKTDRFETGTAIQITPNSNPNGFLGIGYEDDLIRGFGTSDLQSATSAFLNYMTSDYSKEYRTIEAPSFVNIDGQKTGTFLFTTEDKYETNPLPIAMQVWLVYVGSHGYNINFMATTDTFDSTQNIEIRDHLIKSLKFLGAGNAAPSNQTSRF
jgi:hypothetical protein